MAFPPFGLTFYVDDDTFFCAVPEALRETLAFLHSTRRSYDVRGKLIVNRTSADHEVLHDSRHCCWREVVDALPFSAKLETRCLDVASDGRSFCDGAQGGAFAVSQGSGAALFSASWRDAYLEYWTTRRHRAESKDDGHRSDAFGSEPK